MQTPHQLGFFDLANPGDLAIGILPIRQMFANLQAECFWGTNRPKLFSSGM